MTGNYKKKNVLVKTTSSNGYGRVFIHYEAFLPAQSIVGRICRTPIHPRRNKVYFFVIISRKNACTDVRFKINKNVEYY